MLTLTEVRSSVDKIALDGREKITALKQHGQEMATGQLEHYPKPHKPGKRPS